ncbi:hypothetical protein Ciccas_003065 [Cichlidogyrus casuarinus]|uniref:Uncharacterized protein n=1 Tax=Cichlidogyrus casuarinus TaxID=1844966 RepID=A0ABD2QFF4_9PLAT
MLKPEEHNPTVTVGVWPLLHQKPNPALTGFLHFQFALVSCVMECFNDHGLIDLLIEAKLFCPNQRGNTEIGKHRLLTPLGSLMLSEIAQIIGICQLDLLSVLVLTSNLNWPGAIRVMARFDYSPADATSLIRQFLVDNPGRIDPAMITADSVKYRRELVASITPKSGSGQDILGMIGGAIAKLDMMLHRPLQRIICMLHLIELPLRQFLDEIGISTTGAASFTGQIGTGFAFNIKSETKVRTFNYRQLIQQIVDDNGPIFNMAANYSTLRYHLNKEQRQETPAVKPLRRILTIQQKLDIERHLNFMNFKWDTSLSARDNIQQALTLADRTSFEVLSHPDGFDDLRMPARRNGLEKIDGAGRDVCFMSGRDDTIDRGRDLPGGRGASVAQRAMKGTGVRTML